MDTHVWSQLSSADRKFLEALIHQLPRMLSELETSGVILKRSWEDWYRLVREINHIVH